MPTLGLPPEGPTTRSPVPCRSTPRGFRSSSAVRATTNERGGRNVRLRNGVGGGRRGEHGDLRGCLVPTERVFMAGKGEFAGSLVTGSLQWHRRTTAGARGENADVLLGATALLAEIHGTNQERHRAGQATEIVHLVETNFAGAIGSSALGNGSRGKLAGGPAPGEHSEAERDPLRVPGWAAHARHRGGLLSTLPSDADSEQRGGGLLEKYFAGKQGFSTEDKRKLCRYIEG